MSLFNDRRIRIGLTYSFSSGLLCLALGILFLHLWGYEQKPEAKEKFSLRRDTILAWVPGYRTFTVPSRLGTGTPIYSELARANNKIGLLDGSLVCSPDVEKGKKEKEDAGEWVSHEIKTGPPTNEDKSTELKPRQGALFFWPLKSDNWYTCTLKTTTLDYNRVVFSPQYSLWENESSSYFCYWILTAFFMFGFCLSWGVACIYATLYPPGGNEDESEYAVERTTKELDMKNGSTLTKHIKYKKKRTKYLGSGDPVIIGIDEEAIRNKITDEIIK